MTSLPPLRSMLTPNSIVFGEPTKSIAAAAPPLVASMTCLTASGAALSMVATAPRAFASAAHGALPDKNRQRGRRIRTLSLLVILETAHEMPLVAGLASALAERAEDPWARS